MAKQFQFRGVGEKKDRESLNLPIFTKMWVSLISDLTMARWQRRLELLCWNEKDASGIVHAILGLGIAKTCKNTSRYLVLVWPLECFDQRILGNSQIRRKNGPWIPSFWPSRDDKRPKGKNLALSNTAELLTREVYHLKWRKGGLV